MAKPTGVSMNGQAGRRSFHMYQTLRELKSEFQKPHKNHFKIKQLRKILSKDKQKYIYPLSGGVSKKIKGIFN